METNIWWIRRDLRLNDNQALHGAMSSGKDVIPLFIFDPKLMSSPNVGSRRKNFLRSCLFELDKDLQERGSKLIIRKGNPIKVLVDMVKDIGVERIYAEADYSPYARRRDEIVGEELPLVLMHGLTQNHPASLVKKDGNPYRVFTPYMRSWKNQYLSRSERLIPAPDFISTPALIHSEMLNFQPEAGPHMFAPGEKSARAQLARFINAQEKGIAHYAELRNRLDQDSTSGISPYLRFGLLSIRQCVQAALRVMENAPDKDSRDSAEIWLNELIWREFYFSIMYHFPKVMEHSFREDLRAISWRNDADDFSAWCDGRTGYPIVDASMRQLLNTGWMHNRGRMIVASFLVKDLVIDWRWGERFFMQQLLDGDPASNNGGWQWTAGTGTDAAPYFRIFNPILQGKKFDPQGVFIRRWIPELSEVPERYIHTPWEMAESLQKQFDCIIGKDYPFPIVEHGFARERILAVYNQAKTA